LTKMVNDNNSRAVGYIYGFSRPDQLVTLFEHGDSHADTPLDSIQIRVRSNGKPNLVEEGETKWNDYIFSNAIGIDGNFSSEEGVKSNVFKEGGSLSDSNNADNKPSSNNSEPVGPIPKELPLKFTKSEFETTPLGGARKVSKTTEVLHVREKYILPDILSTSQNKVDFESVSKDEGSKQFLERYNDSWNRNKMKEQTGLSDEDIDNMIIRGLEAGKQEGGLTVSVVWC